MDFVGSELCQSFITVCLTQNRSLENSLDYTESWKQGERATIPQTRCEIIAMRSE